MIENMDPEVTGALIGTGTTAIAGAAALAIRAIITANAQHNTSSESRQTDVNSGGNGKVTWDRLPDYCALQHKAFVARLADGDRKMDKLGETMARIEERIKHIADAGRDQDIIERTVASALRRLSAGRADE